MLGTELFNSDDVTIIPYITDRVFHKQKSRLAGADYVLIPIDPFFE